MRSVERKNLNAVFFQSNRTKKKFTKFNKLKFEETLILDTFRNWKFHNFESFSGKPSGNSRAFSPICVVASTVHRRQRNRHWQRSPKNFLVQTPLKARAPLEALIPRTTCHGAFSVFRKRRATFQCVSEFQRVGLCFWGVV